LISISNLNSWSAALESFVRHAMRGRDIIFFLTTWSSLSRTKKECTQWWVSGQQEQSIRRFILKQMQHNTLHVSTEALTQQQPQAHHSHSPVDQ
jgi:hypothetical protein